MHSKPTRIKKVHPLWHLQMGRDEMECALQDNSIPKTAVEGFRREIYRRGYQREGLSAGQISSKKKAQTHTSYKTGRDSPSRHWRTEECVRACVCVMKHFTPTEALKLMDLWGRRIDPWCSAAWSCADRTQKLTAWAERSPVPSKSLGWRSLHSHWHRRNLYRWTNRSPESVSENAGMNRKTHVIIKNTAGIWSGRM